MRTFSVEFLYNVSSRSESIESAFYVRDEGLPRARMGMEYGFTPMPVVTKFGTMKSDVPDNPWAMTWGNRMVRQRDFPQELVEGELSPFIDVLSATLLACEWRDLYSSAATALCEVAARRHRLGVVARHVREFNDALQPYNVTLASL